MKIAVVANTSWNIFNFRMNLIRQFQAQGFDVLCIAPEDEFSVHIRHAGIPFFPITLQAKGNNPFKDLSLMFQLRRLYKKHQPDIILHYTIKPNIYGSLAAGLTSIPCINTVSGLGTVFLHNTLVSKIAHRLYAFSFRFASCIVFQNEDDKILFETQRLAPAGKTVLIPGSGVDTGKYIPSAPFRKNKPFRFLMAARLLFDKGIREYGEAAARFHAAHPGEAEFHIVGSVEPDQNLGISAEELSLWALKHQVICHPFSSNMKDMYHQADVVVLPSYREGLPKVLLEAAACGKPLIATNVPGCKEVVRHGWNGYLCRVKDPEDLYSQILAVSRLTVNALEEMGANSRTLAEESFSDKTIFNQYFCLLKQHIPH